MSGMLLSNQYQQQPCATAKVMGVICDTHSVRLQIGLHKIHHTDWPEIGKANKNMRQLAELLIDVWWL